MEFITSFNFISSQPPTPPTPPSPASEELVSAQTGDPIMIVIAILLLALSLAFVAFKLIQRNSVFAGFHTVAKHVDNKPTMKYKAVIFSTSIMLVVSLMLVISAFSFQTIKAHAANGPITAPSQVTAVVDPETGTISIDDYIATNTTDNWYDFDFIYINLGEGVDDGGCNWVVYVGNEVEIIDSDKIFDGPVSQQGAKISAHYIENRGIVHFRVQTNMEPEKAKALIGKDNVLQVKLVYLNATTYSTMLEHSDGGTITPYNTSVTSVNTGFYLVYGNSICIGDGCHVRFYDPLPEQGFKFTGWTADGTVADFGNLSTTSVLKANFEPVS